MNQFGDPYVVTSSFQANFVKISCNFEQLTDRFRDVYNI